MMKQHLRMHGQTWWHHFRNNWRFSVLAVKAAGYTLGHGIHPRVSGKRASALHNEMRNLGIVLSIEDLIHRLENGLYPSGDHALRDFEAHAELYAEGARLEPFRAVVVAHFDLASY